MAITSAVLLFLEKFERPLSVCIVHYREHEAVGVETADLEYVCQKSLLVELILSDIHDLALTDFDQPNVLESIDLKLSED